MLDTVYDYTVSNIVLIYLHVLYVAEPVNNTTSLGTGTRTYISIYTYEYRYHIRTYRNISYLYVKYRMVLVPCMIICYLT